MTLLPVSEAFRIVEGSIPLLAEEALPWCETLGRVLAADAAASHDDPGFDKSAMDGYALCESDARMGVRLPVQETVFAGSDPEAPLLPGYATRVMTGAPVPHGSWAVVPKEHCDEGVESITLETDPACGAHIRRRGEYFRKGAIPFRAGRRVSEQDLAIGVHLGIRRAAIRRRPRLRILTTGSEIVPPGEIPGPAQVVDCNGILLRSLWIRWGGKALSESAAKDDPGLLRERISENLGCDLLAISGGVSVGERDFVPGILEELGVQKRFHRVAQKPGKPLYFGMMGSTAVFGIPGNPVSTLVTGVLYLQSAFLRMTGQPPLQWRRLALASPVHIKGERTCFEPCRLRVREARIEVEPIPHRGSADLPAWRNADAIAEFQPTKPLYAAGENVRVLLLSEATPCTS